LAFLAVASLYSVLLGEKAYPLGLVLFLVTIVLTAWIFDWFVSVLALGATCLVVTYFVIPPAHSFRMESREFIYFLGFAAAALSGSVLVRIYKARVPVQVIPSRAASPAIGASQRVESPVLVCDESGALLKVSQNFLQFTGKNRRRIAGFQWLETIHRSDRGYMGKLMQKGRGVLRCRIRSAGGTYRWFEIAVEPRFWSITDQTSGAGQFRKTLIVTATLDTDQS
jgi:PAS domain-containing protein